MTLATSLRTSTVRILKKKRDGEKSHKYITVDGSFKF